jgi:MFS family permease
MHAAIPATQPRIDQAGDKNEDADEAPMQRPKLGSFIFTVIVITSLCSFIVGQGLNSGMSVYLDNIGQSTVLSGILAAVFSASAGLARIICGPIIDRSGRYRAIIAGTIMLFAGTLACADVHTVWGLIVCRMLQGIGFGAATTATAAAAADALPLERLGEGIGYFGLGQAIAMSIGPALALFLAGTDPASNMFFGLACIAGVAVICGALCTYEKHVDRLPETAAYRMQIERNQTAGKTEGRAPLKTIRDALKLSNLLERNALPGALPILVLSPAFGFGIFFVGLYGTTIGVDSPGLFFTISALTMVICRLASGRFMDAIAPITLATLYTATGLVAYGLLIAAPAQPALFYAAGLFYGITLGISMPLNQTVAVRNTPPARWGKASAVFLLANDIGIGLSTLIWGFTNQIFGFPVTLCCAMACIALSFIISRMVYPNKRDASKA